MERNEVERAIAGFWSRTVGCEVVAFAKEVVATAQPPTSTRARNLLFAACRLGAFGLSHGLELSPTVLLAPSVIERLCVTAMADVSQATRRTVRSNLNYLAARVLHRQRPPALSRERAKAPYSVAEIAAYLALADSQPTAARRGRAIALICLGAGAGLVGTDLRSVRGSDVVERSGGVLIELDGARRRTIPVRAEFAQLLLRVATEARDRHLLGNGHPRRKNVTGPLVGALAGGKDLPALDVRRLRSTWLFRCACDLGLRAFLDAAGVCCTQRLGDLVARIPPVEEARAVELLGGRH